VPSTRRLLKSLVLSFVALVTFEEPKCQVP